MTKWKSIAITVALLSMQAFSLVVNYQIGSYRIAIFVGFCMGGILAFGIVTIRHLSNREALEKDMNHFRKRAYTILNDLELPPSFIPKPPKHEDIH